MVRRCYEKTNPAYKNYGGRGITVSDRWLESFENFYADMGDKPKDKNLDRVDNNKGYSFDNCKWSSWNQQQSNRRSNRYYEHLGIRTTQMNWSRLLNVSQSRLRSYVENHSVPEAIEYYMDKLGITYSDISKKYNNLIDTV